jgi:hypothetical protein
MRANCFCRKHAARPHARELLLSQACGSAACARILLFDV